MPRSKRTSAAHRRALATARTRRYRRLSEAGMAVISFPADPVELAEFLREAGLSLPTPASRLSRPLCKSRIRPQQLVVE
jgi:hypothetical protein